MVIVPPEKQRLHTQDTEPNKHISNSTKVQHGKPMSLLGLFIYSSMEETKPVISQKFIIYEVDDKCCNPAAVYMIFRSFHKS